MNKESERIKSGGLNLFIKEANQRCRSQFKNLCLKQGTPWNKNLEDIYAGGYLSCLGDLTMALNKNQESQKDN